MKSPLRLSLWGWALPELFKFSSPKGGVGGCLLLALLFSCNSHPGQVSIQGKFTHLEQGEFYIYSPDGGMGRMDTLRIQDGTFQYMASVQSDVTFRLLYPNFSELTIFVQPGSDIEVRGDAQHLVGVEVSGTEDNEVYTAFRQEVAEKSEKESRQVAEQFILTHPRLAVSRYLFTHWFLLSDSVSHTQVTELFDSLLRARPDDVELSRLTRLVRAHGLLTPGKTLPDFKLTTHDAPFEGEKGREITAAEFKDKYLLIAFWASWKSGSQSALYRIRRFRRQLQKNGLELKALSYSLDTDASALKEIEERDSVNWHSYCDFLCFNSPLANKWGISDLPYFIVVGPDLKIIASGSDWQRDIEPKVEKLCL